MLALRRKAMTNLDSILKSRNITLPTKVRIVKAMNAKEFIWTVVLDKAPENTLDSKEIKPVLPKGNQYWIFIGRTDAEAETPILWPPDAKNRLIGKWLIGKDPDAGKDWGWEEKGTIEDWSRLSFPAPGDLPDPEIKLASLALQEM